MSDENQVLNAFEASMTEPETPAANPEGEAAQVEGADAPQAEEPAKVEAEQQEEAQTIEIDPDEPLFEQEVDEDGKKVAQKLSLKELQQGYLRDRDYRIKTQELARQREELPKAVAKQGQELSESYVKRLGELQALVLKTVAADLQGVNLSQLAKEDPFEYIQKSNRMREIHELQQAIEKEQAEEASKRKVEEQQQSAAKWQKSFEILQKEIPDFGPSVVKRLIESGDEWGFTREEVSGWTDHRLIKMLHALSGQKAAEAKRPEIEKKVAVVTKVMKPGTSTKARSSLDEAKAKLHKSGRREDAIDVFASFV